MTVIEKSPHFAELQLKYVRKPKGVSSEQIVSPEDAYRFLKKIWNPNTMDLREELLLILLNVSKNCIGWCRVSIGGRSATIAELSHIASIALLGNASSVIMAHNHPSGNPHYSQQDIILTKRILNVLHLHGIELLDHIIIYHDGFTSIRNKVPMTPDLILTP
jgi:DNA repair protein RadC